VLCQGGLLQLAHLPPHLRGTASTEPPQGIAGMTLESMERILISDTLRRNGGNRTAAANNWASTPARSSEKSKPEDRDATGLSLRRGMAKCASRVDRHGNLPCNQVREPPRKNYFLQGTSSSPTPLVHRRPPQAVVPSVPPWPALPERRCTEQIAGPKQPASRIAMYHPGRGSILHVRYARIFAISIPAEIIGLA